MAQLRVGGKVEGRSRVMHNPQTVSGYPRWNTYASLDMKSAVTEIRIGVSKLGVKLGSGAGRKAKKLSPGNLCHRVKPKTDVHIGLMRQAFERAWKISLYLDGCKSDEMFDIASNNFNKHLNVLIQHRQTYYLRQLIAREDGQGQVRTKFTCKRAGLTI